MGLGHRRDDDFEDGARHAIRSRHRAGHDARLRAQGAALVASSMAELLPMLPVWRS
jgi:hypothetical protein